MKYEKPKLTKGINVLPQVTLNFAAPAAQTCVKKHKKKGNKF